MDNAVVALVNLPPQQERTEHGHEREGKNERAAQREHHGQRHRMKHFPFDAREREKRNIDDRDDDDAKEHRRADLLAGSENGPHPFLTGKWASKLVLFLADLANDVFDDDDRTINDETE